MFAELELSSLRSFICGKTTPQMVNINWIEKTTLNVHGFNFTKTQKLLIPSMAIVNTAEILKLMF